MTRGRGPCGWRSASAIGHRFPAAAVVDPFPPDHVADPEPLLFCSTYWTSASPVARSTMKSRARPPGWSEVPARPATPATRSTLNLQRSSCPALATPGLTGPNPALSAAQVGGAASGRDLVGCAVGARGARRAWDCCLVGGWSFDGAVGAAPGCVVTAGGAVVLAGRCTAADCPPADVLAAAEAAGGAVIAGRAVRAVGGGGSSQTTGPSTAAAVASAVRTAEGRIGLRGFSDTTRTPFALPRQLRAFLGSGRRVPASNVKDTRLRIHLAGQLRRTSLNHESYKRYARTATSRGCANGAENARAGCSKSNLRITILGGEIVSS